MAKTKQKKVNKTRNKLIDSENELVVTNGERQEWGEARGDRQGRGEKESERVIMEIHEIICVKLLKIVKHYRI